MAAEPYTFSPLRNSNVELALVLLTHSTVTEYVLIRVRGPQEPLCSGREVDAPSAGKCGFCLGLTMCFRHSGGIVRTPVLLGQ